MFTTGSKLFVGAAALSTIGSVVFAITTGGPTGFMGTIGFITAAVVFWFLAGINFFTRDGSAPAMEQGVQYTSSAAQPPVGRSMWPAVAALGVAGLAVGVVSTPVVFKVSVVVILAALVEWMVQGWSERASGSASYNASIRQRILHPLEFPILAAVGLGAVIYAFSRIMLGIKLEYGRILFIILGALVLGVAFLFAFKRGVSKGTVAGVSAVFAVGLLGVGVASAVQGQKTIEHHQGLTPDVCLETASEDKMHHADEDANRGVSAEAGVIASVELQSNGVLIARNAAVVQGADNFSEIVVPRSSTVSIVFRNNYEGEHRLTARLGTFGEEPEVIQCTARIEEGQEQVLVIKIPKSSKASTSTMMVMVPSLPGQEIKVLVP
ncbi:MAG TPA: hypothetical protein DCR14_06995 [Acidimicrobiaceae bacterium]|nr:hypothetical protein [Acidimicrobiaceae bacterium]